MERHVSAVGTDISNFSVPARFVAMCGALGHRTQQVGSLEALH
jgi:hypothetical protein